MAAHSGVTRKQEQAIAALLVATTLHEAADQSHVSHSTLMRWLKDLPFQIAYREARRQVVQHAVVQLQQATSSAVATLCGVMQDVTAPASARVSAAKVVLEMAVKAVELEDLEARIAVLEQEKGPDEPI